MGLKVTLSVLGKFHIFDLAREMDARGALQQVFTGYPRFKLRHEGLRADQVRSYPWVNTPYMAFRWRDRLPRRVLRNWELLNCSAFDRHTARQLDACDVFVGMSSSSLLSGRSAQRQGAVYVCDRGSSHIRTQDELLQHEHELWGMPYEGIDPRVIAREEAEYAQADAITVPSTFALRSFLDQGVPASKLHRLSYGVNLGQFHPCGKPEAGRLDLLFVGAASVRKGVPYLLQAFQRLRHPHKTLSFAGAFPPDLQQALRQRQLWSDDIRLLGHLPWDQLRQQMSRSHALLLPSIEEGFGLVIPQALACGCPVIATDHTGAPDLLTDGESGFIVPIRRADLLADRMQRLADEPDLRERMSRAAADVVRHIGGWSDYGQAAHALYEQLARARSPA